MTRSYSLDVRIETTAVEHLRELDLGGEWECAGTSARCHEVTIAILWRRGLGL
jgi:hypothetical protein